jgi:LuxR family maltose regulon positive regulatory protein
MLRWFSQIPEEALTADPVLCLEYSWPLLLSGQFEAAARYLGHARQGIEGHPALQAEILVAKAYLARVEEDYERLVETSQSALALLPEDDWSTRCIVTTNLGLAYWHIGLMAEAEGALAEALATAQKTGNRYAAVTAQIFQARALAVRGRLRDAAALLRQVIQTVDPIPSLALAYLDLGALHYEWNDLEECARNLDQAVKISERYLNHEFLAPSLMMIARLRLACGDSTGALEALQKAHHLIDAGNVPASFAKRIAAAQIQVALAQDDLEEAESWAGQLAKDADCHSFHRYINLTQAHLLLAQNKPTAAYAHLAGCYDQALQAGWGYGAIAARVLQSLSAPDPEEAFELLAGTLRKAQPEGYRRTFADAGPTLAPLLHEAARRGIEPAYVGEILAVLSAAPAKTPMDQSALVEPLSERELEVLRLVAAGLSNRQIAEELTISLGTAKTHVHNICGKLGAGNRTEAAVQAKNLALI